MAETNVADGIYEERSALYYPYIHIRSENWLKTALLAFQKVNRIVPNSYALTDDETISPYSQLHGPDGRPLLDQANIHSDRVLRAQESLFARFQEHEADLVEHYARDHTPRKYLAGANSFQMHRMKLLDRKFADWLVRAKLAWDTHQRIGRDTFDWLTMHPRLGSAVMSVLALAIARQDGLKVVTPSRKTHQTLLAHSEKHIVAKLLKLPIPFDQEESEDVVVQDLCQMVLMTGFDLTRLTPEDVRDMVVKGGRELGKFYGKLSTVAARIPEGLDDAARSRYLDAKADEVLADWRQCTEKLPQLRQAIEDGAREKVVELAIDVAKEAVVAHSLVHTLGGAPGIALAIVKKAGVAMQRAHNSPYAFLNRVEKLVDKRVGSLYVPQWRALAS